jgi:hypothetical protein
MFPSRPNIGRVRPIRRFPDHLEAVPGQYDIATRCGAAIQRILAPTDVHSGSSVDPHPVFLILNHTQIPGDVL